MTTYRNHWAACSPAWLAAMPEGACSWAPRRAGDGRTVSHYHPAVPVPPPADQTAEAAKRVTRAIFALKSPPPPGSTHYRSGWDDGLEAAMDAAKDAAVLAVLPEQTDRAAVARVRALHEQYVFGNDPEDYCAHCNQISGVWIPWPCPTVQALDDELRRVAAEEQPTETQGGFELRGTAEIEAAALDDAATALEAQSCTCGCRRGAEFLRQRSAVVRATAARPATAPDDDQHVCKSGASTYYCPASGEMESDCHGGFDVCCDRPDLHRPERPAVGEQPETQEADRG